MPVCAMETCNVVVQNLFSVFLLFYVYDLQHEYGIFLRLVGLRLCG
jgi:hypothetical protein